VEPLFDMCCPVVRVAEASVVFLPEHQGHTGCERKTERAFGPFLLLLVLLLLRSLLFFLLL
jgi:hypothetical protein